MTMEEIATQVYISKETVRKVLGYFNVKHTKVRGCGYRGTKIAREYKITPEKFKRLLEKYKKRDRYFR